jgi:hypothetical protein
MLAPVVMVAAANPSFRPRPVKARRAAATDGPCQLQLFAEGEALALTPQPAAPLPIPRQAAVEPPRRAGQPPISQKPHPPKPVPIAERLRSLLAEPSSAAVDDADARLYARLGAQVHSLVLTDNRTRIVSARASGDGGLHVRLHRCFRQAPDEVIDALGVFLRARDGRARRQALSLVRGFFRQAQHALRLERAADPSRPAPRRRLRLEPRGEHFDLVALRDTIDAEYFGGQLQGLAITWGRGGAPRPSRRRGRRSGFMVRLGSYHDADKLIRIHPVLDRADVPLHVVASVVHHEMVHAVVPAVLRGGRRYVHTAEFHRLERLFRQHDEAEAWLKANIERLAKLR